MKLAQFFIDHDISLQAAFDTVVDGVVVINSKYQVIHVNQQARTICQKIHGKGQHNWPAFYGIYQMDEKTLYKQKELPLVLALSGKEVFNLMLYLKNDSMKEGKFVSCNARPIRSEDGHNTIIGAVMSFRDMTATLLAEREREKERTRLEASFQLAALGMMMAEVGHEINNPLTSITGSVWVMQKMLLEKELPVEELKSKLTQIQSTVLRIDQIVKSLKNTTRSHDSEDSYNHCLKDILNDVMGICRPKLKCQNISFHIDESNPLLTEDFACHRVQLSQVLINLICNAIDAVEGLSQPWIKLDLHTNQGHLVCRISDSGQGVKAEMQEKIFAPFFSTKILGKGTGLGLSISKSIVESHGGELSLNPQVSASCFELKLPLTKKAA